MTLLDFHPPQTNTTFLTDLTDHVGNTPLLPLRSVTKALPHGVQVFGDEAPEHHVHGDPGEEREDAGRAAAEQVGSLPRERPDEVVRHRLQREADLLGDTRHVVVEGRAIDDAL